jgi:hypothetical protein
LKRSCYPAEKKRLKPQVSRWGLRTTPAKPWLNRTNGLFTLGVNVYDYVNDAHYSLAGYGDANGLALENGKLMVARYNADGDLAPIGELVMVDGALVIAGVEKQAGV